MREAWSYWNLYLGVWKYERGWELLKLVFREAQKYKQVGGWSLKLASKSLGSKKASSSSTAGKVRAVVHKAPRGGGTPSLCKKLAAGGDAIKCLAPLSPEASPHTWPPCLSYHRCIIWKTHNRQLPSLGRFRLNLHTQTQTRATASELDCPFRRDDCCSLPATHPPVTVLGTRTHTLLESKAAMRKSSCSSTCTANDNTHLLRRESRQQALNGVLRIRGPGAMLCQPGVMDGSLRLRSGIVKLNCRQRSWLVCVLREKLGKLAYIRLGALPPDSVIESDAAKLAAQNE